MQAHLDSASNAFELAAEHLEALALEKRKLRESLQTIVDSEKSQMTPGDAIARIQQLVVEVRKGFKKAPPPMKRRLLRKLLSSLVYTSQGLEVYFNVGDSYDFNSEVLDQSLLFRDLPIGGNGWGGRGRTCECQNQNLMAYHLPTPQHEQTDPKF